MLPGNAMRLLVIYPNLAKGGEIALFSSNSESFWFLMDNYWASNSYHTDLTVATSHTNLQFLSHLSYLAGNRTLGEGNFYTWEF